MKRSAGRLFITIFLRSLFIISVLMLTGVVSYKAAMMYLKPNSNKAELAYQNKVTTVPVDNTNDKGITKNLIYCYNKKTNEITKIVLEVLNSNTKQLAYITIPVRTQITLSNSLYTKICLDDPEIPQVFMLSTVSKYLEGRKAFEDEALVVEELLETDINYYTAIPESTYNKMFTSRNVKQDKNYDAAPMEVFSSEYKSNLRTLDSKDKLEDYIKELYPKLQTNQSLEDKLGFLDSYSGISLNKIKFELVSGNNLNSSYVVDGAKAALQLAQLAGSNAN